MSVWMGDFFCEHRKSKYDKSGISDTSCMLVLVLVRIIQAGKERARECHLINFLNFTENISSGKILEHFEMFYSPSGLGFIIFTRNVVCLLLL